MFKISFVTKRSHFLTPNERTDKSPPGIQETALERSHSRLLVIRRSHFFS
ncbi:hypothetical protein VB711_15790 [Cronbergia sp. UHCC 0137]|nr:hypothetical protein [Cronbergia sp. UHCC 0137]MEA5619290.1 hypothetical protein [Cronbergia sp. UHCC 0137]